PNSKMPFVISLVRIEHAVEEANAPYARGVMPDVPVNWTPEHLIEGKDPILAAALEEIQLSHRKRK
ncbi:MAG: hypothetical protein AAF399_06170, partial [Bacteroidota bacterium]